MIKARTVRSSPWYKIKLFRTNLRFRNPKATHKAPKDLAGRKVDQRPFINTAAKAQYDCNEELGRCITNIYFSAWAIYPRKYFSRPYASVTLRLNGLGVTKGDRAVYNDLYKFETAKIWIKNFYSCRPSSLVDHDTALGGGEESFPILEKTLGDMKVYISKPFAYQLDYFIPFSSIDLLQFSFQLAAKGIQAENEKEAIMREIADFSGQVVRSVSLDHAD